MVHLNFHLASSSRSVFASLRLHSPRCHPKFILYKHHIVSSNSRREALNLLRRQRSGAESVRRAGGVKIPVFISIPSSNLAPFYPLAPFTTIPSASLRSFSFRFLGVFLFSYITQDVRFVLSSNPIPLRSMVFSSLPHSPPSCDHF